MHRIDVHKLADEARSMAFTGSVLFWCALIIIFDGYDLAVAGIALAVDHEGDGGRAATNAGFMVSSALFGMMFGAIFLGTHRRQDRPPLGDRRSASPVQRLHRGRRVHQRPDHLQRDALPRRARHRRRDAERGRADDRILAAARSAARWSR